MARSRLGSNSRGNKSVPNIRDVQDDGQVPRDDLSRRDLSARFDAEEGDHVITHFEVGTQRSVEKSPAKIIETDSHKLQIQTPANFENNGAMTTAYHN